MFAAELSFVCERRLINRGALSGDGFDFDFGFDVAFDFMNPAPAHA